MVASACHFRDPRSVIRPEIRSDATFRTKMAIAMTEALAVEHPDVEQRAARGKEQRKALPRAALAEWAPPADRAEPFDLLSEQETTRVPELVPIRHERMRVSPFAFYRGAAVVMAADLASGSSSGLRVQCCGDAHLSNFGGFSAPDRRTVFDINDFDETSKAPFEWDVKRLAASFEIATRARGLSATEAESVAQHAARSYREAMQQFATMSNLDVWYARLDADALLAGLRTRVTAREIKRVQRNMAKAQGKDNLKAFDKLTERVDGNVRIISDPPLIVRIEDMAMAEGVDPKVLDAWLRDTFRHYRQSLQPDRRHLLESYEMIDIARKVVGVGSVGTRCWIVLLLGKDEADPLFLQVKEAERSVLEPHAGKSEYANHGQRVVEGQRLLQASSDIMLGWFRAHAPDGVDRDYYVRQLWDGKLSADIDTLAPESFPLYAEMCAGTLARAHARSGDRVAIASYLGSGAAFDRAIGEFAAAYADQNQRDYESFVAALGRSP
jgi:uncharacterized protein (DUF2252 family)